MPKKERTGHVLMGSFGWKSTDVTVPLCPGSYVRVSRRPHNRKHDTWTNLVQHPPALDVPDTHHSICTAHGDPATIVILAPCPFQQGAFEPGRCALEDAVNPGRGGGKGTNVVDNGLRGERGGEEVTTIGRECE
jgi:hypothetical protein